MARKRKNVSKASPIVTIALFIIALFTVLFTRYGDLSHVSPAVPENGVLTVHFIDVGQGNSTLIQSGTSGVLIDAGETDYGDDVCNYISSVGVTKLDYVIATHPHSDHIGGMAKVLQTFSVGTLYAPELDESNVPTSRVYERFLDALSENGADAVYAEPGDSFTFNSATFSILGPVKQLNDLNNMSVITRMDYGETSFLFVGDAEKQEMKSLCENGGNYKADIYLMGHHGSRTAIYTDFLKQVNPSIAVISCGTGNSYGHPHDEALKYIEENNITCLRTDLDGDIVFTCKADGYTYTEEKQEH